MKKFLSILFILVFNLSVFSQEDDTKYFYESSVKNEIFNALFHSYDYYTNWTLPEEEGPHFFGCGTAAHEFSRDISEKKRTLFYEKYSFLVDEILKYENDPNKLKNLEVFWIKYLGQKNEEEDEEEENPEYKKWQLKNQYKSIVVTILVEELYKNNELLSLDVNLQKKNEQFSKKYSFSSKNSKSGFVELKQEK